MFGTVKGYLRENKIPWNSIISRKQKITYYNRKTLALSENT